MRIHAGFTGIDISKQLLNIFEGQLGKPEHIANGPEPIAFLVARWVGADVFVLIETTGPYDAALCCALSQVWLQPCVNAARACDFARACVALAKTDGRMLAAMAQSLRPATQEFAVRGAQVYRAASRAR